MGSKTLCFMLMVLTATELSTTTGISLEYNKMAGKNNEKKKKIHKPLH